MGDEDRGVAGGQLGRRHILRASLAAGLIASPAVSNAQAAWPARPIRVIVPFAAGGATDLITRLAAEHAGPLLGQQVVIDNRGGAQGMLGMQAGAQAPADGYTFVSTAPGVMSVNPWVVRRLPYDPEADFTSVAMIASIPYVMVVPKTVPARTVAEFIALARARPGALNFSTSGNSSRLVVELFRAMVGGLDMTMVQYRSAGSLRTDLLRGDIHLTIDQMPGFLEDFQKGELFPLAVSTRTRSPALPHVPTMEEAGIPGYEAAAWVAYSAPRQTPGPIVSRMNAVLNEVLRKPEVISRLANWGADPVGGTAESMEAAVNAERTRWGEVVRRAGIQPE
jgi:tripartite-type tricarboxylate transporter receptor subunit TctC